VSRHREPNASYYSTRYAERKRAAERARDAAAGPRTCNRCPVVSAPASIFCVGHAAEYDALMKSGASPDACSEFCRRIHWPGEREDWGR
jgi:hypothetical protein